MLEFQVKELITFPSLFVVPDFSLFYTLLNASSNLYYQKMRPQELQNIIQLMHSFVVNIFTSVIIIVLGLTDPDVN